MSYEIKTLYKVDCVKCNCRYYISAFESDIQKWQNGTLIQNALPYLTADERDLVKLQICGKCYDAMSCDE